MAMPISFIQAILGADMEVDAPDGKVKVAIPPGTQPDHEIRIRKRGMPDPNGGRRGDLHVHVRIVIPQDLSREQKRAIADLVPLFKK